MATRLIDEESCQKHAYEECNAAEQREYCAMIATLQQANREAKTGHRPPTSSKYQKKRNLEKAGRLLVYSKLDKAIQSHLDEARRAEWANYLKF